MQQTAARPTVVGTWYLASRPHTVSASIVPVLVGTAMAAAMAGIDLVLFVCTLLGSVLVQIGTNLTDEYVDHRKSGASKFPAPHKVLMRGLLSERAVFGGMVVSFVVATLLGLFIVSQAGWPILAVALASVFVAYFYSAGPLPLGDIGLGEITVFVFMGPLMVLASYYVQVQDVSWPAFWASVPVGLLVTSIMQCNNARDLDEDRRTGKRTLARLLGGAGAKAAYAVLVAAGYSAIVAGVVAGWLPGPALLALLTMPLAVRNVQALQAARERMDFNRVLVRAARLHAYTGAAFAVGLFIG